MERTVNKTFFGGLFTTTVPPSSVFGNEITLESVGCRLGVGLPWYRTGNMAFLVNRPVDNSDTIIFIGQFYGHDDGRRQGATRPSV